MGEGWIASLLPLLQDKTSGDLPSYRFLICYRAQVSLSALKPDSDLLERLDLCDVFWTMAMVSEEWQYNPGAQQGVKMSKSLGYLFDNKVPFTVAVDMAHIDNGDWSNGPRWFAAIAFHVRIVEKDQAALYKLFNR